MVIDNIAAYLEANDIGVVGTDIFIDFMPDSPDDLVVLYEYAGTPAVAGVTETERRIQVNVRAASYPVGRDNAWNVFNFLDNPENWAITINNKKYVPHALQTPHKVGMDEKERNIFTFNIAVPVGRG